MRYSIALVALLVVAACDRSTPTPTGVESVKVTQSYADDAAASVCPDWDPFCEELDANDKAEINTVLDRFTRYEVTACFQLYVRAKMALIGDSGGPLTLKLTKFSYYGQVAGYSNMGGAYIVGTGNGNLPQEISINRFSLQGGSPGETFKNFSHESKHSQDHINFTNNAFGNWTSGYMQVLWNGEPPAENAAQDCYNPAG
jgi:hypothetical protein